MAEPQSVKSLLEHVESQDKRMTKLVETINALAQDAEREKVETRASLLRVEQALRDAVTGIEVSRDTAPGDAEEDAKRRSTK